jgi:hypothetical protein
MDISDHTTRLELRIKGRKFQVVCLNTETRLDQKRKPFTAYHLQIVDKNKIPLAKSFHRRYHQFKQLSSHLLSYNFEHPKVPDSGGLFNTSTTQWLVEQRKVSIVRWINQLLDTIEITAIRGRQKAESRLGLKTPGTSPVTSPVTSKRRPSRRPPPHARPIRQAARAIMEFLNPRPEVDPAGTKYNDEIEEEDRRILEEMPPTPMSLFNSVALGGGGSGGSGGSDQLSQLNSSWSTNQSSSTFNIDDDTTTATHSNSYYSKNNNSSIIERLEERGWDGDEVRAGERRDGSNECALGNNYVMNPKNQSINDGKNHFVLHQKIKLLEDQILNLQNKNLKLKQNDSTAVALTVMAVACVVIVIELL